jgi:hypothetical protein
MKSITTKLAFLFLLGFISVNAQDNKEIKYRRSSLSMILIESDQFPNKEAVMGSWNNYPFPDKYNKHDIAMKSVKIEDIKVTDEELLAAGFLKDTLKLAPKIMLAEKAYQAAMSNELTKASAVPLRYLNAEKTIAVKLPNEKQEYQVKVDKIIKEKKLANQLVSTWFGVTSNGFDQNFSLIAERGFYNASDLEIKNASGTVRSNSSFSDAGLELIRNTFVTFTKLNFVENEPVARVVRDLAKAKIAQEMASAPQVLKDKAFQGVDAVYEKTKEGYSLWSKTWLYRLNWNDSIAALAVPLLSNKSELDKSDLFSLEFVGAQFNNSLVTFKIGEKRTESQIIDLALVRNVDNAFAELQRENDVFKAKTPVASADPTILAKIGKKEGLKGGEKFEVLERTLNEKTGLTEYKKVGTATVDKKLVWDNRYTAGEEAEEKQLDKDGNPITATVFKGSKKIQPGMLLKFIK